MIEGKLGLDREFAREEGNITSFMDLLDQSLKNTKLKDQLFYRLNIMYMGYDPGFYTKHRDQFLSKISSKSIRKKALEYWQFLKYQKEYTVPLENYHLEDLMVSEKLAEAIKEAEGKTIYLDFWATWCGPCREDMKASKGAVSESEAKGDVAVIYVCVDNNESARKNFLNINQIPGTHITIPGEETAKIMSSFGNSGYPFQVIISPNGGIMAKGNQYRFTAPYTQKLLNYKRP